MNKLLSPRVFSSFIKYNNLPSCINCVHFIKNVSNYPYDPPSNNKDLGKCKLFGSQNLVTGEIVHTYASICRIDGNKCGEKGKYFKDNK